MAVNCREHSLKYVSIYSQHTISRIQEIGLCKMRLNCPVTLRTKQTYYFFDSDFNIILQSSSRRWDSVRLRTGRSGVQIPAGQDISPPSGVNAASCSVDMVGSSALGRPGFEVTSAYPKNERSYTSTSHMPSWSAQKKLYLYCHVFQAVFPLQTSLPNPVFLKYRY